MARLMSLGHPRFYSYRQGNWPAPRQLYQVKSVSTAANFEPPRLPTNRSHVGLRSPEFQLIRGPLVDFDLRQGYYALMPQLAERRIGLASASASSRFVANFEFDKELQANVANTLERILNAVLVDGIQDLVLAYSGGKDSTTLLIIAAHAISVLGLRDKVHLRVIFSDTRLELPPLTQSAYSILRTFRRFCDEQKIDYTIHVTEREISETFWVLLLGRGYPPPNRYFRWCTDRLKIQPPRAILKKLTASAGLATGVRVDESDVRAQSLRRSCSADGECGMERWTDPKNTEGLRFYAPLLDWRTCKVWDFLIFWAAENGWPVSSLVETYGSSSTRFGCWTCTLVDEDKALRQVTSIPQWKHLAELDDFRRALMEGARRPENRLVRSTGAAGKLTLAFRRQLLDQLLELQSRVGHLLISDEEVKLIHRLWQEDMPAVYRASEA